MGFLSETNTVSEFEQDTTQGETRGKSKYVCRLFIKLNSKHIKIPQRIQNLIRHIYFMHQSRFLIIMRFYQLHIQLFTFFHYLINLKFKDTQKNNTKITNGTKF